MTNKFWPRNFVADGSSCARAIPAPVGSIYRPFSADEVLAEMGTRARNYNRDVTAYLNGELSKDDLFRAFNAPVYGAYGETL